MTTAPLNQPNSPTPEVLSQQDQLLLDSIQSQVDRRDKFEYGSENWQFFNRDVEKMREELAKRNLDDRFAYREWK